jgi:hypothetical protein
MNCRLPIADLKKMSIRQLAFGNWAFGNRKIGNRQSAIGNGSLLCCFGP